MMSDFATLLLDPMPSPIALWAWTSCLLYTVSWTRHPVLTTTVDLHTYNAFIVVLPIPYPLLAIFFGGVERWGWVGAGGGWCGGGGGVVENGDNGGIHQVAVDPMVTGAIVLISHSVDLQRQSISFHTKKRDGNTYRTAVHQDRQEDAMCSWKGQGPNFGKEDHHGQLPCQESMVRFLCISRRYLPTAHRLQVW